MTKQAVDYRQPDWQKLKQICEKRGEWIGGLQLPGLFSLLCHRQNRTRGTMCSNGHNLELVQGHTSGSRSKPQHRHFPQQLNPQISSDESNPSPALREADVQPNR